MVPEIQNISISDSDSSSVDNSLRNALHFKPLSVPDYQQSSETPETALSSQPESVAEQNKYDVVPKESVRSGSPTLPFVGVSLREYEAQRRMMEEQNRHKKDMIYKAIEQRYVQFHLQIYFIN